jgi:hypothetical protein
MSIVEDLERLHTQRPSNPFTIHLSDGMNFSVPTAEYLGDKPGSTTCYLLSLMGGGGDHINLKNVTRLSHEEAVEQVPR